MAGVKQGKSVSKFMKLLNYNSAQLGELVSGY